MKKYPLSIVAMLLTMAVASAADYTWTGAGSNNNFSTAANWSPSAPPTSSAGDPMDLYFGTSAQNQIHLNRTIRYRNMYFSDQDYWIEEDAEPLSQMITNSQNNAGVYVDGVDVTISAGSMAFNATSNSAPGIFSVINGGSLTVNLNAIQLAASSSSTANRTLRFLGDGEINVNAAFTGGTLNSSSLDVHQDFTGIVRLNSTGSTIARGALTHNGSGIVEFGADDAIGGIELRFSSPAAKIQAGNGARTLSNLVTVGDGFIVTGSNSLTLAGAIEFGGTSTSLHVQNTDGRLVLSGELTGSGTATITTAGAGIIEISGDNTATLSHDLVVLTGGLVVSNASGSATGTGQVQIGTNAFLAGSGRLAGSSATLVYGQVRLEESMPLRFGNDLVFESTSQIYLGSGGVAGVVEGDLMFQPGVEVLLDVSGEWQVGQTYRLFDLEGGTITGELSLAGGYMGLFSYVDGPDGFVAFELAAIPEPGHIALLLGSIAAGVLVMRYRRR